MEFGRENFETSPDITQIGYAWEQNAGKIWFDSSNVNDAPFIAEGFQNHAINQTERIIPELY
jgi:hypothetical protein